MRSARPTRASISRAMRSASARGIRRTVTSPSMTFSSAVMWGKRLYCWKTMPISWRLRLSSAADSSTQRLPWRRRPMGWPSTRISPSCTGSR